MINEQAKRLLEKAKIVKDNIAFFERKGNKLLSEIFEKSDWYPACHNNPEKKRMRPLHELLAKRLQRIKL